MGRDEKTTTRGLVRSLNGIRIHRSTCQWAKPGHVLTWKWADTVSDRDLLTEVVGLGLRPCAVCDPLEGL